MKKVWLCIYQDKYSRLAPGLVTGDTKGEVVDNLETDVGEGVILLGATPATVPSGHVLVQKNDGTLYLKRGDLS